MKLGEQVKDEGREQLLSVSQAARLMAVSDRTVWRMIGGGELTVYRFRRCTRVSRSEVLSRFKERIMSNDMQCV